MVPRLTPAAGLLAATVAAAAPAMLAPAASASTISRNASIRSCVNTSSYCDYKHRVGTFSPRTKVSMRCWIDGRRETAAYTSVRWFLVRRLSDGYGHHRDGYEGFIHASTIPVGKQTKVGWCRKSRRVMAGLNAAARLGQKTPSSGDVKLGGWTLKGPTSNLNAFGPLGDWGGDCAKLAWIAYRRAGKPPLARGDAWSMFSSHWNHPVERGTNGFPRYGALVGWNWNPGHIAISIGGRRTASTIGLDNLNANAPNAPNGYVPTGTNYGGPYFGWVVPK